MQKSERIALMHMKAEKKVRSTHCTLLGKCVRCVRRCLRISTLNHCTFGKKRNAFALVV